MIMRLSQKLGKKIKEAPTRVLPLHANPYADWSAHLFTAARVQYVLLTNTASLYSVVLYGAGITDDNQLITRGLNQIREVMADDGQEFCYLRFIAPATRSIQFSKALNRSVVGSMNDLVQGSQYWLIDGESSPYDISFKLNETPMATLGYANPREALKALVVETQV